MALNLLFIPKALPLPHLKFLVTWAYASQHLLYTASSFDFYLYLISVMIFLGTTEKVNLQLVSTDWSPCMKIFAEQFCVDYLNFSTTTTTKKKNRNFSVFLLITPNKWFWTPAPQYFTAVVNLSINWIYSKDHFSNLIPLKVLGQLWNS